MRRPARAVVLFLCAAVALPGPAFAAKVRMKDGREYNGKLIYEKAISPFPQNQDKGYRPVIIIDDDLRYVFFNLPAMEGVSEGAGEPVERFSIPRQIPGGGAPVASVGPLTRITPWSEDGRRIVTMMAGGRARDIIQGIEEITPNYTRISALRDFKWDMRVATSTIDPDRLHEILLKVIDKKNVNHRLRLVRFYLQMRRFQEARQQLDQVIKDFPEEKDAQAGVRRDIRQLEARALLMEIDKWQRAGLQQMSAVALAKFPSEDVAGETLQQVRRRLDDLETQQKQWAFVKERLPLHVKEAQNAAAQPRAAAICEELLSELNINTLDRVATYQQFADNNQLLPEEKVAFAISGWLLGSKAAVNNLRVAVSLYEVRELIRKYCNEPVKVNRDEIVKQMLSQEGATPEFVALLLGNMKPPKETAHAASGFYELTAEGRPGMAAPKYLVQLPPEYDPYRRYPVVVTLHGAGSTPLQQLEYWAGSPLKDGTRFGHAARNGYIVIAPAWGEPHQIEYGYTLREHLAVLDSLRDACRRFAVDTDRVFLSGHSMGGDAAWDLGLAHPDLWAGVIPIVARSKKYTERYWQNAKLVPMYLVGGQLDGAWLAGNASSLDRYIQHGYAVTIVEFRGRGHEIFSDEILNLFDWMGRYKRDFLPREFTCSTLRPFDNYFYWAEFSGLPAKSMVVPDLWPPEQGTRNVEIEGKVMANNAIHIRSGAQHTTVWLGPEMVDFSQAVRLTVDGAAKRHNVEGSLEVLLEDARSRGDRQHPFWAKIEVD
ncbi:MAG: peptidase [Planctomycetia bacterium]|nr:peptidase [Planctomycetia bacterium]